MEKTKFTFVSPSQLLSTLAFALLTFLGLPQAFAQDCPAPEDVTVSYNCDGVVVLDWDITDPNGLVQTYTVDIENGNQPVVDFVNMTSTQLTIVAGTLTAGTTYNYAITANCAASNVSSAIGQIEGADIQDRQPTIVISNVNNPYCPGDEFSGSFDVTVNDDCGATYDINVGGTTFFDVSAGNTVTFDDLSADENGTTYTVNLSLASAGGCQFNTDQTGCVSSVTASQTLFPTDDVAPTLDVTASGGVVVGTGASFTYSPPEGECGVQLVWSVFPFDDCSSPSEIDFNATIENDNPAVDPTASFTQGVIDAAYVLDIFAATGTNTLTISATDENGNNTTISYTIEVIDSRAPEIYGPGDISVEIPACQDGGVPVNWTVSAVDDCDLDVDLVLDAANTDPAITGSGGVLGVGSYDVAYTATDDYGNSSNYGFTIDITQAASPAPIVDISGNGQFSVPSCADDILVTFSGNIYDCDLNPGDLATGDIEISVTGLTAGADATLVPVYVDSEEDFAYFEFAGPMTAGDYVVVVSYRGVSVDHSVSVVEDPNQPAEITMPGNLSFLAPVCSAGADLSFQVQITDDCDFDLSGATFTLNGAGAPPFDAGASDPQMGLYVWNLAGIPAGSYTLVATYIDNDGASSEGTATFTVTDQPDNSAPIIVYPSQNINVALDPCGDPVHMLTFNVSAIDNCDGDITPDVSVSGAATLVAGAGNTYVLAAPANMGPYTVTIEAEDAAGNSRTETFTVSVTQEAAPVANLACNDNINVTLDDNCSRVITADMVLEGNFGCATEDDFVINIVNDDDPSNGNILDGHGQFIYEITTGQASFNGFVGAYAPANWNIVYFDPAEPDDVEFTADALTITASANAGFDDDGAVVSIAAPTSGTISFDYAFQQEALIIDDIIIIDINGNILLNIDFDNDQVNTGSGSISEDIPAGAQIIFSVEGDGFATSGNDSFLEITNFSFTSGADLGAGFEPCWGFITGEDKTAPVIECPDDTDVATVTASVQQFSGELTTADPQINCCTEAVTVATSSAL
ncbi:MAG: hypothetical protein RIC19_17155 [Phaeodactylibacter sp.]|uniref:hypothetical protein n=1 Tax=Phaeodactylibacter sp. TaxID=1940289 RepID=UPI0032EF24DF